MSELRITDTNSANDSRGRAFGLEGNDFIYVLIAFVISLALYLVFAFALRTGMAAALVFSVPVFLTNTLRTIFGSDTTVTPMDDLAHFTYYSKFLNPSLAERFDVDFAAQFNGMTANSV